ncbi:saccharopine dehydrogenase family protein [Mycolicibacterium brumae]|uniref:L-lysine dehydrogenase n=1 Tax=Mycolicibacterium brumae TaxID=85968 RepID=A0A2G5P9I2_9MYCO|nr:saccharopine dehydrogenase C-terminal domain-containing protein [Mycolicibacterium brumae]MCV7193966.1 saccharopine dehydrogenase NADP-binding domain-containing protein [Mycolicibacterium brumae]PIB74917.1 L-lysine dehydrogenase [Mycolicibacterium brumae]UWW08015.1 saccharopine dehydrogenase NADP-binding domain-containing protein [Mycolicibacterium brumae]
MAKKIDRVAVFGLGKVGELVAGMLVDSGFTVVGHDVAVGAVDPRFEARATDLTDPTAIRAALADVDAIISCLPYNLNIAVAEAAYDTGVHYFDLTEDVPTTNRVIELSERGAKAAFAPQCGLAPGLIGIIGASMAKTFDSVRSIELKVGALPQNPTGLLGYAFNWSAAGVINEYINDAEVVRNGNPQMVPAMTETERVVIGGVELEASLTSGGLGTMCQTYAGKLERLDYKTLRYPGHFAQMRFLFDELRLRNRRELVNEILVDAKPPVNDDIVYLHASVEGVKDGKPFRENYVRGYLPADIGGHRWRAISWTTAASAVAVVELVDSGRLPGTGFIRQEDISFADLCDTKAGQRFLHAGR